MSKVENSIRQQISKAHSKVIKRLKIRAKIARLQKKLDSIEN